jgi:U3 small nucleolar RNA-associated protein 14
LEDVYELVENEGGRRSKGKGKKPRRETVDLEYDYGEDGADGRDEDPEDDERREPRLFGEGDMIDSEDDEEIDSDAAFEDIDGDADGFAGVFGRVINSSCAISFAFLYLVTEKSADKKEEACREVRRRRPK